MLDCREPQNVEYWICMEQLCEHDLMLAKKLEPEDSGSKKPEQDSSTFVRERQFYVEDEIKTMLAGKSCIWI